MPLKAQGRETRELGRRFGQVQVTIADSADEPRLTPDWTERMNDLIDESKPTLAWRSTPLRWRMVRVVGITTALAAIGAITVGLLPVGGDGDDRFRAGPAAGSALRGAADNAEAAPAKRPTELAGKYLYTQSRDQWIQDVNSYRPGTKQKNPTLRYREELIKETWSPVDGNGQVKTRETIVKREAITPAADLKKAGIDLDLKNHVTEQRYDPAGPNSPKRSTDPFNNPTPERLAKLPTNPDILLRMIKDDPAAAAAEPSGQLTAIMGLVRRGDALLPPKLRKALFLAAMNIDEVENFDQADVDGRPGVAIGVTREGYRTEIIINPKTSRVLGERFVTLMNSDGLTKGTVIHWSSTTSTIVNGIDHTTL